MEPPNCTKTRYSVQGLWEALWEDEEFGKEDKRIIVTWIQQPLTLGNTISPQGLSFQDTSTYT